ncbi:MAG: ABC transporter substrate-binding protein [Rhizobiaceae bacterium]|nr:ABC transporter substrate-binding protein [Rhizobiaceae bacterium]
MSGLHEISAAFLPLTDSAVLVAAAALGFAEAEGLRLALNRETSWANVRDRMAVGHFDVAHMLAPMPIAFNLGLCPLKADVIAPMALGLGGNAVTVSVMLHDAMQQASEHRFSDAAAAGAALRHVVRARKAQGQPRLALAVVHPHSVHNLELRYWLAASGIAPDRDVEIVIVPPPLMADALAAGRIDGFCVGEPWNSVAVARGQGRIATVKAAIWRSSPEKVLGVRKDWAEAAPERLAALIRALYRAAQWCGDPAHHEELAALLARPEHVGVDVSLIRKGLDGRILALSGDAVPHFFEPFGGAATFPWQSHALWLYSQMVRWGMVSHGADNAAIARRSYRPDLYRAALRPLGAALPGANAKVEGALTEPTSVGASGGQLVLGPDGFFDGTVFDPDLIDAYVLAQAQDALAPG